MSSWNLMEKKKLWYHSVANIITFCITVSAHFIHSAANIAHLQCGKSICPAHLTEPNIMWSHGQFFKTFFILFSTLASSSCRVKCLVSPVQNKSFCCSVRPPWWIPVKFCSICYFSMQQLFYVVILGAYHSYWEAISEFLGIVISNTPLWQLLGWFHQD